jgi:hypothetical protein
MAENVSQYQIGAPASPGKRYSLEDPRPAVTLANGLFGINDPTNQRLQYMAQNIDPKFFLFAGFLKLNVNTQNQSYPIKGDPANGG